MVTSFLTPATQANILALRKRGFQTAFELGTVVSLVLYRDTDEDGTGGAQSAQSVRMVLASRSGQARYTRIQADASDIISETGEFQKFAPFNVQKDDRFTVDGIPGHITALYPIDVRGVARASFVLES